MDIITKYDVARYLGISSKDFYLLQNGRIRYEFNFKDQSNVQIIPTILGGKGGFGSMLRAIGAQIEKTTNREACRDLSGRRLRDINEEKRLKKWINQQAEREKQAEDRRQKKLERLCQKPRHEFRDEEYDKERSMLPEKIEDALTQGLKASVSSSGVQTKRKCNETNGKNKKTKLWVDSDEELSSSIESDNENVTSTCKESINFNDSSNDSCSTEVKCFDNDLNDEQNEHKDSEENLKYECETNKVSDNKCEKVINQELKEKHGYDEKK